jgi:hypothetical protein
MFMNGSEKGNGIASRNALFILLVALMALAVVFYHRNDQIAREPGSAGSVTSAERPDARPAPPPNS